MPKMIITKMTGFARRELPPLTASGIKLITPLAADDFAGANGAAMDPTKWTLLSGTAPTIQGNGLQLASGPGATQCLIENNTVIAGDFDAQVDFSMVAAPAAEAWGVDFIVYIDATHGMCCRYQGLTHYWTQGYANGGAWSWATVSCGEWNSGKLRIYRLGNTLYTAVYREASGGWLDISSGRALGAGNCKVRLASTAWTTNPAMTWKADNFVVRPLIIGAGICEGTYHEMTCGIEECEAENKPEAFEIPVGARINQYDGEWEHWVKQDNPDDFPGPDSTFCTDQSQALGGSLSMLAGSFPRLLGGWNSFFGYSNLGVAGGDKDGLNNSNYDINETDTAAQIYDPAKSYNSGTGGRGTGGFNPPDQGVASIGGERVHYGSLSSSLSALARMYGYPGIGPNDGTPWRGFKHYGHDYEANPTPPPATVLHRVHDGVAIWYPPRWVNHWMAGGRHQETNLPAPVGYVPKGAKCGVFMPIIMRFLIHKRKKDKIVSITAGAKK